MGEEAVFLSDIKNKNQQIAFVPSVIVIHSEISSTEKIDFSKRSIKITDYLFLLKKFMLPLHCLIYCKSYIIIYSSDYIYFIYD